MRIKEMIRKIIEQAVSAILVVSLVIGFFAVVLHFIKPVDTREKYQRMSKKIDYPSDVGVKVPEWSWINVMNPAGIRNGNGYFEFNETCGIEEGGMLLPLEADDEKLLVVYFSPYEETYGTPCPSETVFYISIKEFESMQGMYEAKVSEQEVTKKKVTEVLEKVS